MEIKFLLGKENIEKLNCEKFTEIVNEISNYLNVNEYVNELTIIDLEYMDNDILINNIKYFDEDYNYKCKIGWNCPHYNKCFNNGDLRQMVINEDYKPCYCLAKNYNNEHAVNMEIKTFLAEENVLGFYSVETREIVVNLNNITTIYEDYIAGYLKKKNINTGECFDKFDIFNDYNSAISGIIINNLGHELYHAYQRKNNKKLCCKEATLKAFNIFNEKYINTILFKHYQKN